MKYIELPSGVNSLKTDERGYPYFEYLDKPFYLHEIAAASSKGKFVDEKHNFSLTVTESCPIKDQLFVEYMPAQNKPSEWVEVVNGLQKEEENKKLRGSHRSWVETDAFRFLSNGSKKRVEDARKEQKEDRYQKGPKSV
ncbi:hypothetical protein [Legionella impletisoli]|uniref:Uncharacterized protein n=1 Tax=Legionella impletisoli TaxID=343510 RepID=A0A917JUH6_9GAMM|nr:hypothetical protein [Legionella impletisoli]GGI87649.1 hypothetical protein GCM10007966_15510 [Legionella impletisoli]